MDIITYIASDQVVEVKMNTIINSKDFIEIFDEINKLCLENNCTSLLIDLRNAKVNFSDFSQIKQLMIDFLNKKQVVKIAHLINPQYLTERNQDLIELCEKYEIQVKKFNSRSDAIRWLKC